MIADTINQKINEALKNKDDIRVSTLRLLSDALHNEWIAKQRDLTEEEEIAVVRRQVKMREEAIEALRQAQGKLTKRADIGDKIKKEQAELSILREFLPAQMNEGELAQIVEQAIKETGTAGPADFGRVMGQVMPKVAGRADGKTVAEIVREKLG